MKIQQFVAVATATLALSLIASQRSEASEVLYNGAGFMQGTQSFTDSFTLASPGTLTVTLGNVGWPQPLASLDLLVSSPTGVLGPELDATSSPVTSTFNVAAGNVVAQWFGTAQGPLNAGVYSLEIQYQAETSGNPVPLPTSIGLLLSGLALLAWQRRAKIGDSNPALGSPDAPMV